MFKHLPTSENVTIFQKKITGEDDEVLKKCGTPTDVNALLQPSVVRNKSDGSASESDDNSDGEHSLSTATGMSTVIISRLLFVM